MDEDREVQGQLAIGPGLGCMYVCVRAREGERHTAKYILPGIHSLNSPCSLHTSLCIWKTEM